MCTSVPISVAELHNHHNSIAHTVKLVDEFIPLIRTGRVGKRCRFDSVVMECVPVVSKYLGTVSFRPTLVLPATLQALLTVGSRRPCGGYRAATHHRWWYRVTGNGTNGL